MTARAVTMWAVMDERDDMEQQVLPSEELETVEGVLVAEVRPLAPVPATVPVVHAAAAAATGFVAGAATLALLHRHSARKLARTQRSVPRRAVDMLPIVGTRTFLVDVHLIAKPTE